MSLGKRVVMIAAASVIGLGCTAFTDPTTIGPGGDEGCTSHAECQEREGVSYVCSGDTGEGRACVDTEDFGCRIFDVPDLLDTDAILVGSLIPKAPDQVDTYISRENAIRMAFDEINAVGPIYDGRGIVLIGCSDDGNAETGEAAAEFLANDVGVSAIIGPAFSSVFDPVVTDVTGPAGVYTISMSATRADLGQLNDNGMGWRTAPSDAFQGAAIADLIGTLGLQSPTVVTIHRDDSYGTSLASEIGSAALPDGAVYNPLSFEEGAANFDDVVASALGMQPNVVILAAGQEVVPILETFNGDSASANITFILSDGGKVNALLAAARNFTDLSPSLVYGIDPQVATEGVTNLFTQSYLDNVAFEGAPANYAAHAYDAAYVVAYGIAAITGAGPVQGTDIAANMEKLISGQPLNVGADGINSVLGLLREGDSVDLTGASGSLDFDLTTGDVPPAYGLWNLREDPSGAVLFAPAGEWSQNESWSLR